MSNQAAVAEPATPPSRPAGRPGIGALDVERAADALLRAGERPTLERMRLKLGRGSPNTIQPLLDQWWKTIGARLDSGPAALHRIPESVLHIVEALWLQVLAEARSRAAAELAKEHSGQVESRQALEVRSYVLNLREGELDRRLRDQEAVVAGLQEQIRTLTTMLRLEQAGRATEQDHIQRLLAEVAALRQPPRAPRSSLRPRAASGGSKGVRSRSAKIAPADVATKRASRGRRKGKSRAAVPRVRPVRTRR